MTLASGAVLLPALGPVWAARADEAPQRLVVVMLRGAVDGLNVVVPYGERAYYDGRPTIAIQKPGGDNGALALDDHFALHPALASLMPLWSDKKLAFIHAAGSPDPNRSHFDAQQYIENGTPGRPSTPDGWMNRTLAALPGARTPTDALSVGPTLPFILRGPVAVANLPLGPKAAQAMAIDQPQVASAFDKLYAGNDRQSEAYRQGREARTQLIADMPNEEQMADNGAPPANAFPAVADRLAGLMTRDRHIRFAFAALGGWDTHVNQGNDQGQLAGHLRPLGDGLAALAKGLGPDWNHTVVVVISEFGRTVRENGNPRHRSRPRQRDLAGRRRGQWRQGLWRVAGPCRCAALPEPRPRDHHRLPARAGDGARTAFAPAGYGDGEDLSRNAGDARESGTDPERISRADRYSGAKRR